MVEEIENIEALPGETVTLISELPEAGLEVTWLKDNVPLRLSGEKYEAVNLDFSYQLVVPDVSQEDAGVYKVQGGQHEAVFSVSVNGKCCPARFCFWHKICGQQHNSAVDFVSSCK